VVSLIFAGRQSRAAGDCPKSRHPYLRLISATETGRNPECLGTTTEPTLEVRFTARTSERVSGNSGVRATGQAGDGTGAIELTQPVQRIFLAKPHLMRCAIQPT
jgi:hypothetical protein